MPDELNQFVYPDNAKPHLTKLDIDSLQKLFPKSHKISVGAEEGGQVTQWLIYNEHGALLAGLTGKMQGQDFECQVISTELTAKDFQNEFAKKLPTDLLKKLDAGKDNTLFSSTKNNDGAEVEKSDPLRITYEEWDKPVLLKTEDFQSLVTKFPKEKGFNVRTAPSFDGRYTITNANGDEMLTLFGVQQGELFKLQTVMSGAYTSLSTKEARAAFEASLPPEFLKTLKNGKTDLHYEGGQASLLESLRIPPNHGIVPSGDFSNSQLNNLFPTGPDAVETIQKITRS